MKPLLNNVMLAMTACCNVGHHVHVATGHFLLFSSHYLLLGEDMGVYFTGTVWFSVLCNASSCSDCYVLYALIFLATPKQHLQDKSATSLKIQVTQPEHKIHRELLLEYREESEDPESFQRITIPEDGVVDIPSLEPCTRYAVRLIVVRCDGSTSHTEVTWETLPKGTLYNV